MNPDTKDIERSVAAAVSVISLPMEPEECSALAQAMAAVRRYAAAQQASQALHERQAALIHEVFMPRSKLMGRSDLERFAAAQQQKLDALALEQHKAWGAQRVAFEGCLLAAARAYAWAGEVA